jgi:hypothetical protein
MLSFSSTTVILMLTMMMPPADPPKPITKARAIEIARKVVARDAGEHALVIIEDKTVERPFGWVFFYTTRQYVKTGDPKYLIPGSAPLVVHRADGATEYLATSIPPARAIEIYEKRWFQKQSTANATK